MRKTLKESELRKGGATSLTLVLALVFASFACTTNRLPGSGEPSRGGASPASTYGTSGGTTGTVSRLPASPVSAADDAAAIMAANRGFNGQVLGAVSPGPSPTGNNPIAAGWFVPPALLANPQLTVNSSISSAPMAVVSSGAGEGVGGAVTGGAFIAGTAVTGAAVSAASAATAATPATATTTAVPGLGTTALTPTITSSAIATPTVASAPALAGTAADGRNLTFGVRNAAAANTATVISGGGVSLGAEPILANMGSIGAPASSTEAAVITNANGRVRAATLSSTASATMTATDGRSRAVRVTTASDGGVIITNVVAPAAGRSRPVRSR